MALAEERLMDWLRDAHAMEEQAETMLGGLVERLEHYPALKERVETHLEETRRQADLVRGCLEQRGGTSSALKDTAGKMVAFGQAMSGLFVGDEVVKGAMISYAFEHMEIAAYRILISAAEAVGDTETARTCRQILAEEEAMADWLATNMPDITKRYLAREETPGAVSRH